MKKIRISQIETSLLPPLDRLAMTVLRLSGQGSCESDFTWNLSPGTKEKIIYLSEEPGFDLFLPIFSKLNTCLEQDVSLSGKPKNFLLLKLEDYVSKNYMNPISVSDAGRIVCMSETTLYRFLKRETGFTLVDYIHTIRIEYACRLLLNTNDTVAGIGYSCGFGTADYFIRIFKRIKGVTPGEYRKQKV